jgi:hypothetical protein
MQLKYAPTLSELERQFATSFPADSFAGYLLSLDAPTVSCPTLRA